MNAPIAYAMRLQAGESRRKILCLECCGGEPPKSAREVLDTASDRKRFGVPSDGTHVVVCHRCGQRLDGSVLMRVYADELVLLRSALAEATGDRALIDGLIARLEAYHA